MVKQRVKKKNLAPLILNGRNENKIGPLRIRFNIMSGPKASSSNPTTFFQGQHHMIFCRLSDFST